MKDNLIEHYIKVGQNLVSGPISSTLFTSFMVLEQK